MICLFLTGNYFLYKQFTKAHKKEFKAFIRSNYTQTETIEIVPSELYSDNASIKWLDHNKEVLLNDRLYDIVGISSGGTKVILTVVNDTYEKDLMNRYEHQYNESSRKQSDNKGNQLANDFFSLKYLHQCREQIVLFAKQTNFLDSPEQGKHPGFLSKSTPPPNRL